MSDDGRASMVCERVVSEDAFRRLCDGLRPMQTHSAPLRSVSYGQESSGGLREETATERDIGRGTVGRGRRAWARLERAHGEGAATLRWLVTFAHAGDLASLAVRFAEEFAPALRAEVEAADDAQRRAATNAAAELLRAGGALTTAGHVARVAAQSAAARETRARAALLAFGLRAMTLAAEAWESAREERAA